MIQGIARIDWSEHDERLFKLNEHWSGRQIQRAKDRQLVLTLVAPTDVTYGFDPGQVAS